MSERKPVLCPWCKLRGIDSLMEPVASLGRDGSGYYWCRKCDSTSSRARSTKAAYLAATRTPPNPSLLLPELFELSDDDAAWVVAENGKIYAMGAECAQEWASEEHCLFFARKPTPEDIEAAKSERGKT